MHIDIALAFRYHFPDIGVFMPSLTALCFLYTLKQLELTNEL